MDNLDKVLEEIAALRKEVLALRKEFDEHRKWQGMFLVEANTLLNTLISMMRVVTPAVKRREQAAKSAKEKKE